ncbi:hypothetical protein [Anaerococcus octavius]|uniref:hypothetical protein n=1 Tax=Anaerococcus octavius TaxID=54007 RepID=UPI003565A182
MKQAYKNGAKVVFVNSNPKNKRAIAFYEKQDFKLKDTLAKSIQSLTIITWNFKNNYIKIN